ncbi:hypothetical protein INT44_003476 [Umbelopsis vinacea]|uniref:Reverse transcriptase zinc-binding domain-containing protein n=1 Tax=Umbelopsis vinacea TaxID=44442 RepID=A0A8H7UG63_9FUNG|nr:hypothetical protein INT44_003476 [Umbelopsis vinacea]
MCHICRTSPGYATNDFFVWSQDTIRRRSRSPTWDKRINWLLKELEDSKLQIVPAAQQCYIWNTKCLNHPVEWYTVDDIPKLDHWVMQFENDQSIKMSGWTTGSIRNYWRDQESRPLPLPPLRLSSRWYETIRKSKWTIWWKLEILHAARSSWWRIIHDKLLHRRRLHVTNPVKYPSPACPFYQKEEEDGYHLVVGCHYKWEAWRLGLDIVQYSSQVVQPLDIQQTMLLQYPIAKDVGKRHSLVCLSIVWAAIWKIHWHCLSKQLPWSLPMCLQTIRSTDFLSFDSTD